MDTKEFYEDLKTFCERRLASFTPNGEMGYKFTLSDDTKTAAFFINSEELTQNEVDVIRFLSERNVGDWTYGKQFVLQSEFVKKDQSKSG